MKEFICIFLGALALCSCKQKKADLQSPVKVEVVEPVSFFPVTNFIKGQIADLKTSGINPIKYIITGAKKDSSWLSIADFDKEFSPFLHPEIDTLNMVELFTEKKFLDQSINAYTFTYDAKKTLPDTMQLTHWDVYINPQEGKVQRIYMVKKISANIQQQLTWQAGEWCKIINIKENTDGSFAVQNEEQILWKF